MEDDHMKKLEFMVDWVFPGFFIVLGVLVVLACIDSVEKEAGLKDACKILGGVYVSEKVCIAGKNLFVEK